MHDHLGGKVRASARIRDPIHGYIEMPRPFSLASHHSRNESLAKSIWAVLKLPVFQRLRYISQVGFTPLTFPSATHTRFTHSLGAMSRMDQVISRLRRQEGETSWDRAADTHADHLHGVMCLAALVHDIGHAPFSHQFETAVKAAGGSFNHDVYRMKLVDRYIQPVLEEHMWGDEFWAVRYVLDPSDAQPQTPSWIRQCSGWAKPLLDGILDVDKQDYLMRDAHYTGTPHGEFDHELLVREMRIVKRLDEETGEQTGELGIGLTARGVDAFVDFVRGRTSLYQQVYFHPVTRGFEKRFTEVAKYVAGQEEVASRLIHPINLLFGAASLDSEELLRDWHLCDEARMRVALQQIADTAEDPSAVGHARSLLDRTPLRRIELGTMTDQQFVQELTRLVEEREDEEEPWYVLDNPMQGHKVASKGDITGLATDDGQSVAELLRRRRVRGMFVEDLEPVWRVYFEPDSESLIEQVRDGWTDLPVPARVGACPACGAECTCEEQE